MARGADEPDVHFPCPVCGEMVPVKAAACPYCGADEETGWDSADENAGLALPDEEDELPPPSRVWLYVVAAVSVLALLAGLGS